MFPYEIREDEKVTIVELGLDMKKPQGCTAPVHSAFQNVKKTLKKKKDNNNQEKKQAATTSTTGEIRPKDIVSTSTWS